MHHTFNPEATIAESSLQVRDPSVRLTVDVLFYENELLNCDKKRIALDQIRRCLGVSFPEVCTNGFNVRRKARSRIMF